MKEVVFVLKDRFKTKMTHELGGAASHVCTLQPEVFVAQDSFCQEDVKEMRALYEDKPYDLVAVFDKDTIYYRDPSVETITEGNLSDFMKEVFNERF